MAALMTLVGAALFAAGYAFGRMERKQRRACAVSELRGAAAKADFRLVAAREANRRLALKAAIASSPLAGVRDGG